DHGRVGATGRHRERSLSDDAGSLGPRYRCDLPPYRGCDHSLHRRRARAAQPGGAVAQPLGARHCSMAPGQRRPSAVVHCSRGRGHPAPAVGRVRGALRMGPRRPRLGGTADPPTRRLNDERPARVMVALVSTFLSYKPSGFWLFTVSSWPTPRSSEWAGSTTYTFACPTELRRRPGTQSTLGSNPSRTTRSGRPDLRAACSRSRLTADKPCSRCSKPPKPTR